MFDVSEKFGDESIGSFNFGPRDHRTTVREIGKRQEGSVAAIDGVHVEVSPGSCCWRPMRQSFATKWNGRIPGPPAHKEVATKLDIEGCHGTGLFGWNVLKAEGDSS